MNSLVWRFATFCVKQHTL